MNNIIKSAIARIFTAVINADGIVSTKELEHLEKVIMPKYGLKASDFKEVVCTFAEAVNTIKTSEGERYLKRRYKKEEEELKKKRKNEKDRKVLSLTEDMEELARADGGIHPKEALLCLAYRLSIDENSICSLCSFNNKDLRFSKQEVIYVESEKNEDVNKEIEENYQLICYSLQSFGFKFVYIPRIRKAFESYSEEYKIRLIQYRFPNLYASNMFKETLSDFSTKVSGASTESFSKMLMSNLDNQTIEPSILIKIGTTQKRNPDKLTDFIMLKMEKGKVLATLQSFLAKYDDLCEENSLMVRRGKLSFDFNIKSFYNTFLEYITNNVNEIEIHIYENRNKVTFRYGILNEISMRSAKSALYITEMYYSIIGNGFSNDLGCDMVKAQFDTFKRIYEFIKGEEYTSCRFPIEFYGGKFCQQHNELVKYIESWFKERGYIMRYCPPYDTTSKKVLIPSSSTSFNVVIHYFDGKSKEENECDLLKSWVERL